MIRRREREIPEASSIWKDLALLFMAFAFGAAVVALTVPDDVSLPPAAWVGAATALVAMAVLCFCAHWDVNRGRRWIEIEEVGGEE